MLKIFTDSEATNELTTDEVRDAVPAGETMIAERQLFLKSDSTDKTYENVSINALNDVDNPSDSGEISYRYAADDGNGSPEEYVNLLEFDSGDFDSAVPFWRKAIAPNVQNAFKNTEIEHNLQFDEYIK